ncbi:hypothetical protein [Streptomyces sp. NPDC055287]
MIAGPIEVGPDDARYDALHRGFNQRWIATPDYVVVATTADEVVAALARRVRRQPANRERRITVRSGGHCYEAASSGTAGADPLGRPLSRGRRP